MIVSQRQQDFDYDAAGRLTQEGDKSYAYGWLDKVMSVSDNGKLSSSYDYGIDGQLASRTDATGKSESFTWDGLALIKRDSTNFVNESAITGGNPILAFGKDSSKALFEDMLGNTVGSVEGGKFNAISLTSFGESNSDSELNFFTGKPQVEGLGYAFLFRNYRSEQGKWQTADPMDYPDGWNNLAYCNNNVNIAVDRLGLENQVYTETITSYRIVWDGDWSPWMYDGFYWDWRGRPYHIVAEIYLVTIIVDVPWYNAAAQLVTVVGTAAVGGILGSAGSPLGAGAGAAGGAAIGEALSSGLSSLGVSVISVTVGSTPTTSTTVSSGIKMESRIHE